MKLSAVKLFELAALSPDLRGKLEPLVSFVNTNFDQVLRALSGQLNLDDNLSARRLTVSLSNGIAKDIVVVNAQLVVGILPLRVQHPSTSCLGVGWRVVDDRTIRITPTFSDSAASGLPVSLGILYS